MSGIDWYQDPNDPTAPAIVTPQPGQVIKIIVPATHKVQQNNEAVRSVIIAPRAAKE